MNTYFVVFRSNLRPIYEFFPAACMREKKFILEVIYHFSPSMLVLKMDEKEKHSSCISPKDATAINLDKTALKNELRQHVSGERSVANSISHRKGSSLSLNEQWRLSADSVNTCAKKSITIAVSNQDKKVCSSFDDESMLALSDARIDVQQPVLQEQLSLVNKRLINNSSSTSIPLAKSPSSTISFDDRFEFSCGECSESNSTQPTSSGSNSMSSPFLTKYTVNEYPTSILSAPAPLKGILLNSTSINEKADDGSQLKKKFTTKTKQQLETVIEEMEKSSTTTSDSSNATCKDSSRKPPSTKNDLKFPKFTNFHPDSSISISSFVPTQINNFGLEKGLIEKTVQFSKKPPVSQWLNGNTKLFNMARNDTDSTVSIPANVIQSNTSSQYSTPAGSIKSIPSQECITEPLPTSSKKQGKQPAQKFQAHYQHRNTNDTDSETDDWSPSSSPSVKTDTSTIKIDKSSSSPVLTEAEAFKRQVQQTYEAKENPHNIIYKNIFLSTPTSNTTSQIRYYDDDDDDDENDMHQFQGGSSQLRSYTMTPRSRYSQQTRSSSANLTPEEYLLRKKSRETSFMMLVPQESKQQLWLRAVKQSTLSHWLQTFSVNAKKQNQSIKVDGTPILATATIMSNDINISSGVQEIRLKHYSSNNRTIKKKKGFYLQKGSNRRQKGIIL
jgi:hypothetical protein